MKFNEEQQEKLLKNPNVKAVSDKQVYYTEEFREKALAEYALGKSAKQIFIFRKY